MFTDKADNMSRRPVRDEVPHRLANLAAKCRDRLALSARRRATRRHLAALDADQLADVGITRGQALREVRQSFPLFGP
ncbi:MAG: DUF1127 domain-containing protein [Roseitalea sp.]|jgi:uncharacterized protein YjiS (DUF1127 family)|nr:DUF1127 domain-containing protein [Roseitalea sp.]MBO6722495.1 DUF1127 domain-containing protein [Roseitalea sp.]MBO6742961.1 DUF1127 domain-containing protein [Roseitalea sp.]